MAKPICVVKVDNRSGNHVNGISPLFEVQSILDQRLTDYHVLVVPFEQSGEEDFEPMRIQVFHEKDFTDIQYAELKQLIQDSLPKQTNNG